MKSDIAKKTFAYYWQHVRRVPQLAVPVGILLPINTLLNNYGSPLIMATVLNRLSTHAYNSQNLWPAFRGPLLLYLLFQLLPGAFLWRIFDLFYWRLEARVEQSIAEEVFASLMQQSADFHANHFGGSLVSATSKLTGSYVRLADTVLFFVAPLVAGLTFVTIVMFPRSPLYAITLLAFSILYIIVSFIVSKPVRDRGREVATAESKQTGTLADAITNVMAIKSFAREREENVRFHGATERVHHRLVDMMYAFQRQQIYLSNVTGIMSAIALAVAILSVGKFGTSLATAFLIFNYTGNIANMLFQFSNNALRNMNRSFGDAADMLDILELKPAIVDPKSPEPKRIRDGAIDFRDVTFTHKSSDDALFSSLNLAIKPGEKIGLVGHSGSGKTTLTRVLLRFSDIDNGEILIDGQNIAHITQDDLRSSIAYVPQEPLLFHRSIRENIAYGKPTANEEEIIDAAKKANAHEFIVGLKDGYDTLVGERGVKLSGGQRQRIAIARAILKDAPILVLDEATSALDSESELLIQVALWKLMENRTAIAIAHRLSTIQKMDRIIVLDKGKIIEQGSHKELLARKNGTYAKLWAHQSGGFIEE